MNDAEFYRAIEKFNAIYKLPAPPRPELLGPERVRNFHAILAEEVTEGLDLAEKYEAMTKPALGALPAGEGGAALDVLAEMADWLGDIVVYCASEARRWGIPLPEVLGAIMESNFSKLGPDGKPIYDERGKVMKGPGYFKPEPRIREILRDL